MNKTIINILALILSIFVFNGLYLLFRLVTDHVWLYSWLYSIAALVALSALVATVLAFNLLLEAGFFLRSVAVVLMSLVTCLFWLQYRENHVPMYHVQIIISLFGAPLGAWLWHISRTPLSKCLSEDSAHKIKVACLVAAGVVGAFGSLVVGNLDAPARPNWIYLTSEFIYLVCAAGYFGLAKPFHKSQDSELT